MYVKLFADILASSLWDLDSDTRVVWVTLLVMADEDGVVRARTPGIAHMARLPKGTVTQSLARLSEPDPESRTEAHEGRRIESIEDGYLVLNYRKYRDMKTPAERREDTRKRVQVHREKKRSEGEADDVTLPGKPEVAAETPLVADVTLGNTAVTDVTLGNTVQRPVTECNPSEAYAYAEAYAEAEAKSKREDCAAAHLAHSQLDDMPLFRDDPKFAEAWASWFKRSLVEAHPNLGPGGILYDMRQAHAYAQTRLGTPKAYTDYVAFVRNWIKRGNEPKAQPGKGEPPRGKVDLKTLPGPNPDWHPLYQQAVERAGLTRFPEAEWNRSEHICLGSAQRDIIGESGILAPGRDCRRLENKEKLDIWYELEARYDAEHKRKRKGKEAAGAK